MEIHNKKIFKNKNVIMEKSKILSNFIWRFAERSGAQAVQFMVSIVLARILAPEIYGTIALVLVFAQVLQVFVDSGLGNALIQKKDADDTDFSSVFYFNILCCLLLYALIYVLAPVIAAFYNNTSLIHVIRVLCLTIVISGVKNVQQAYVSRTMQFKKFFFSTLAGTIVSAVVGIYMAINGYGVWALVAQKLVNLSVDTLILWITVKWRPKREFSFERLKILLNFGWKLLVSALIDTIYTNLRQLIIGKIYTEADLAYYNRGNQFPNIIVANINSSIDSVLLPVMSKEQDNPEHIKAMTRRAIKTSIYIIAPIMMGMVFAAKPLVQVVLTDKWLPCVPYLRIFCITYMFYPIHTANLNAINAMGRSGLFLKLEIAKKIVGMILLLSTMWFGVMAMAYSLLVSCMASQIINSWPNKKLLGYGYTEQLKDILPSIILSVFMGICIYLIPTLGLSPVLSLLIQMMLAAVIYGAGSVFLKLDSFQYLYNLVKRKAKE